MTQRRVASLLALACTLLACEPGGLTLGRETADVETMQALWDSQGMRDYYIEIRQSSEWVLPFTMAVEVRDGAVTRIRGPLDQAENGLAPAWRAPDAWDRTLAVDSLYARMARLEGNPEVVVDTRFDTRLGVPTWIFIDMPAWADDSYGFAITRFVRQ